MRRDLDYWWRLHPGQMLAAGGVLVVTIAAVLALAIAGPRRGARPIASATAGSATSTASPATPPAHRQPGTSTSSARRRGATVPSTSYRPSYSSSVPDSKADQQSATIVAQDSALIAATESFDPPAPAWTAQYPAVPRSTWRSERVYLTAFVTQLLNRDYRTQSRANLARWVSAESAAALLPGVPPRAADNNLYASLFYPRQTQTTPGVAPPAAEWAKLGRQGVRERVTHVFINPDESWVRDVSAGLTSRDPLTDEKDVNGTMTVTRDGRSRRETFSLTVSVGSALHHPGYGASGVDGWAVS